ncbi:MAG: GNAT family N-acetyltransferase/peptidase C39 family protein [Thalassolituus sp.]
MSFRLATTDDISTLTTIENASFPGDRLNARRFRHFIRSSHSELWVAVDDEEPDAPVEAYILVLFHRGTSLARLYSIAVAESSRGKGLARQLLKKAEHQSVERGVFFMRLEVRQDNLSAIKLYEHAGYRRIRELPGYYDDGGAGWRLEKHLGSGKTVPEQLPFYAQTTPFTCGPSALLMALRSLKPGYTMSRIQELNIWREATTIYLTTGHGGCSAQGLALAARARDIEAKIWVSDLSVPFIDGVRNAHKREVLTLVSEDFAQRCESIGVSTEVSQFSVDELRDALADGKRILLLISTYRMNRNKAPHWVWLVAMDDEFAYINDPDVDDELDQAATDNIYVPVSLRNLGAMCQYGSRRYMAAVLLA